MAESANKAFNYNKSKNTDWRTLFIYTDPVQQYILLNVYILENLKEK